MSSQTLLMPDSLATIGSDGSPRFLVVDALNLLTEYFLGTDALGPGAQKNGIDAWTLLEVMQRRVAGFLDACASSTPQLIPHFVIDAGWKSDEAASKWRKRRELEVRSHKRGIPLSCDTFLADALRAAGAPVYQVEGEDGDDIVALLAHALATPGNDSLVLSADRDMFRYDDSVLPGAPTRVASDFSFANVKLKNTFGGKATPNSTPTFAICLHPSPTQRRKDGVSMRGMGDMPAFDKSTDLDKWSVGQSKLRVVVSGTKNEYVRGACSPETRACGNLHGISRPLRLAVYRAIGLSSGSVHEHLPEWDEINQVVRWEDVDVDVSGVVPVDVDVSGVSSSSQTDRSISPETVDTCDTSSALFFDRLLRDTVSGPKKALQWLRNSDPSYTATAGMDKQSQINEEKSFRGFSRVAIVAECFAAVAENATVLGTALAMRRDESDDGASDGASASATANATANDSQKVKDPHPLPSYCAERYAEHTTSVSAKIKDLFAFPPESHVSLKCAMRGCSARFVVSGGERVFLFEKNYSLPTRCKPCRDSRKASRGSQQAGRGGFAGAPPSASPGASPGITSTSTMNSVSPVPGTAVALRPRTLRPSATTVPTASETAQAMAALSVKDADFKDTIDRIEKYAKSL